MAKTLLELVTSILSSMDGDEVTSINDTVESLQVAHVVRDSFEDLQASIDFPSSKSFFQLTELNDIALPVFMTKPTDVLSLDWIKYDNQLTGDTLVNYIPVTYQPFIEFMSEAHSLTVDSGSTTEIAYTGGLNFTVRNDRFPTKYTTYNDSMVIFNSYNSVIDTFLTSSKTLAYGLKEFSFSLTDSFVIPLDTRQTNLLLNAAKAQAFVELKQVQNPIAERRLRRGLITSQRTKTSITQSSPLDSTPNYGRRV